MMKRLSRDPIRFDLINVFAEYGREEKVSLRGQGATTDFVERVRNSIVQSLSNEALLHGVRTESMFEALVASLGAVQILKHEDAGDVYVSDETLHVPDFRIVLADGSQMLIEVKNFYQAKDLKETFEVDRDYLDGLVRYAKAMTCPLFLAVYWTRWNIWTLVAPETLEGNDEKQSLNMLSAMQANHMVKLGDFSVGTRFPLSLVMRADKAKPRRLGSDGNGQFTVGKVELYCAGEPITDPGERRVAMYLMFYGKWIYEMSSEVVEDQIETVEHRWSPQGDHKQGFEIVGSMSELFCNFYKFATQDEQRVEKLRVDVSPGSLGNLIPNDYKGTVLRLWRFRLQPSTPGGGAEKESSGRG